MERLTITISETAELLGISKSHAYEMAQKGELPVVRLGQRYLVPKERLLRWLDER